ncbi:DUF6541 family protein [Tomitella fengzijianii]|uniref:Uncharacterized protein n=1 Tax=Tomitella fengzijianii TaxID=2597660 RepID=A0A516X039_9ACTN|nr:DUF6541 family protein [Tomitella fengzijianii]QDQ96474.1 hypothetical protein FO059_02850 [Tomitella fengzijianii]
MQTALLAIVGALLLLAPGFLVGLTVRLRWTVAAALAIPVTFGMVVVGTIVTGASDLPWNLWSALVTLLAFLGLGSVYSLVLARRRGGAEPAAQGEADDGSDADEAGPVGGAARRAWLAPPGGVPWAGVAAAGVGVLVGAGTIFGILFRGLSKVPDGIASLSNVWDQQWHANVISFIDNTGIAGATDLGRLFQVETHADFYYPDAWHALGALLKSITGSEILPVINIWTMTCLALVIPLSAAVLAWRIVRDRFSPGAAALAAGCAGAVSGVLPSLPYVEFLTTANPNAVGAAMSGMVVVLVMSVTGAPRRIPLAALGLIGIAGVHPSGAVFSALLLGLWWLFEALWRPRRSRLRDLAALVGVAVLTIAVMLPQIQGVLGEQTSIESYDFSLDISRLTAVHDAFTLTNQWTDPFPAPWVLLAFAVLACVVLLARFSVWMTVVWAVMLLVVCDAIEPIGGMATDLLRVFSNAFYTDPRRLQYAVALIVVALAGAGIALAVWGVYSALRRWAPARRRLAVTVLVLLTLAVPVTSSAVVSTYADRMGAMAVGDRFGRMISPEDRAAMEYLATLPDARTTTIFVDPDQGMGWMYALEGLHPLFTHFAFPEPIGPRTWTLWDRLNTAGINPRVDAALQQLDIKYVVMSPPVYWPFQTVPRGLLDLDRTPGLERIYFNGETKIYEVRGWEPPKPGETRYGWDPFADRSSAENWVAPAEVLPPGF